MKTMKLALASFLVLLLSAAVSMESSANNFALKEIEKPLLPEMLKQAKEITQLSDEQKSLQYESKINLASITPYLIKHPEALIPTFGRIGSSIQNLCLNVSFILYKCKNDLISSEGVIQIKPFEHFSRTSFSLYLIPALKRGDQDIVDALIKSGASFDTLKQIAQGSEESAFIDTLIEDYQSKLEQN